MKAAAEGSRNGSVDLNDVREHLVDTYRVYRQMKGLDDQPREHLDVDGKTVMIWELKVKRERVKDPSDLFRMPFLLPGT